MKNHKFFNSTFKRRSPYVYKKLFYLMSFLMLVLSSVSDADSIDPNLVGWWKLDEGSGATAADSSGYGHNGTISNSTWATGKIGKALDFNQTGNISVSSAAMSAVSGKITIAFWQYGDPSMDTTNYTHCPWASVGASGGNTLIYLPYNNDGGTPQIWYYASNSWTNAIYKNTSASSEYKGQWNHWAFTKNSSTGYMKIYLNGSLWHSGNGLTLPINGSGASSFMIGSYLNSNHFYDGKLDEVRIYNCELSQTDIQEIYNTNKDTTQSSNPNPGNGGTNVSDTTILSWAAGIGAASHNVYFGTSFNDVNNATNVSYLPGDIDLNGVIDIHDLAILANYWLSYCRLNNNFCDGTDINYSGKTDSRDFSLLASNWLIEGYGNQVNPVYKGNQVHDVNSYTPGTLALGKTYYWRIDEINSSAVYKGDIWSFTVAANSDITLDAGNLRYKISGNGVNREFKNISTGINYCDVSNLPKCAKIATLDGLEYYPSLVSYSSATGQLTETFLENGTTVIIDVTKNIDYMVFEVNSVTGGSNVARLDFVNLALTNAGTTDDAFPGCVLAMNLNTNVLEFPGSNKTLRASSYSKFGLTTGAASIVGVQKSSLRSTMKTVVTDANTNDGLFKSTKGGPWAMDDANDYGSYVFDFTGMGTSVVQSWIDLCSNIGIKQINLCGGIRYGDFALHPTLYPGGKAGLTSAINTLHAAGIKVGMHSYAFFISKDSPYATPIPDSRLAYDKAFTLSSAINSSATTIYVNESTAGMSLDVTPGIYNSVTLRIGTELITYTGLQTTPPYAFTGCTRGANGTTAASHSANASAYHLKECLSLFVPDVNTTLFAEVAANMASLYNDCGFDMLYFDALDVEAILAGPDWGWYYGSKFCDEVRRRITKDPIWEMSTFHHHLWFIRSRIGAIDRAQRSFKTYTDIHAGWSLYWQNMFMPTNIGWWLIQLGLSNQNEITFSDDTEHFCTKAIGYDSGVSIQGIDPASYNSSVYKQRLTAIFKKYEILRQNNYFSSDIKQRMKAAGEEFIIDPNGANWDVHQAQFDTHKVGDVDGIQNVFKVHNRFANQPLKLRIHALKSAADYSNAGNTTIADVNNPATVFPVTDRQVSNANVTLSLSESTSYVQVGTKSLKFEVTNNNTSAPTNISSAWAKVHRAYSTNLNAKQAMGVWIYGDGKGEVLNFQLNDNSLYYVYGDHYAVIDFKGWRYFEFMELPGKQAQNYYFPYGDPFNCDYRIYFLTIDYGSLAEFNIYCSNLPANDTVTCYISPVKALADNAVNLTNCSVTVDGNTVSFPATITSGYFLEFNTAADCNLYTSEGALSADISPTGTVPTLKAGENTVIFNATSSSGKPRANVTVITKDAAVMVPGKSTRPTPASGTTAVTTSTILTWLPGAGATSHNVYFGTDSTLVTNATTTSTIFQGNQTTTSYTPTSLSYGTKYYWRIDEVNTSTVKGDTWNFSTGGVQNNLVGWWKLDEGSGSTAGDSSGYGHNGTITNSTWVTGKIGNALDFQHTGNINVSAAAMSNVDSEITIAFWSYGNSSMDTANYTRCPFASVGASGGNTLIYLPYNNDGGTPQIYYYASNSWTNVIYKNTTSSSEYKGQWNHWAFTKNANTGASYMKIYLNGSQWHSGSGLTIPINGPGASNFAIGSYVNTNHFYDGKLDDIRLYNKALNIYEVNDIYTGQQ